MFLKQFARQFHSLIITLCLNCMSFIIFCTILMLFVQHFYCSLSLFSNIFQWKSFSHFSDSFFFVFLFCAFVLLIFLLIPILLFIFLLSICFFNVYSNTFFDYPLSHTHLILRHILLTFFIELFYTIFSWSFDSFRIILRICLSICLQ